MKYLRKTLTRDAPLIAVEGWYEGLVKYTRDFFKVSFPDCLFLFRNQVAESYRDTRRLEKLSREIAQWSKENPGKIGELYRRLDDAVRVYDSIRVVSETTVQEILQYIRDVKEQLSQGLPGLFCMHWFPVLQEKEKIFDDDFIKEAIKWRERQGDIFFNRSIDAFYILFNELAQRKGWLPNDLKYVTLQELAESIEKQKPLPVVEIKKRQNSIFAYINGKVVYGSEIDRELEAMNCVLVKEESQSVDRLRGIVAYPGKVRGRVKVVYNRKQLGKVKRGDIVVAPMTSPWYIPAIRRAVAIITDEGGITCHAAIVSRELKKPCIIGTKVATEVLRDGDLVEVDTEKGEVMIVRAPLERKKKKGSIRLKRCILERGRER